MTLSNDALEPPCRTTKPAGRQAWPAELGTILVLALLCWACFFKGIDQLFPLDKTESLQIALVHTMARTGDWVTPAIDGLPYFDKPPLPYWLGVLLQRLAPEELWLPRLGAATAGCVGVAATFVLVRLGSGHPQAQRLPRQCFTAAAVLALTPGYIGFSRTAVHDIYLTASITTTLTIFFLLSQAAVTSNKQQLIGGGLIGASLGVGILAKGLLSLGLPIATAVVFLMVAGPQAHRPFTWRFLTTLVLGLGLVAFPWHLAAWQAQGDVFLNNYFIRTHVSRFATELDDHEGPWFFYLLAYPALTFPWCVPAAAALVRADCLDPRRWRRRAQSEPLLLFCSIWILTTVGLLSLASTKLPHYILSSLPPTAIAAGLFFWPPGSPSRRVLGLSRSLLLASATVLLIAALLLAWLPSLLIPISEKFPGFTLALRTQLGSLPTITGLLLLAAAAGWAAWTRRRPHLFLGALWAACILSFLLFLAPPLLQAYRQMVQEPRLAMADRALQEAGQDEPIQVVGRTWYSIKLHTDGRAQVIERGKAFAGVNQATAKLVCTRTGLLLGPSRSVERTAAACAPGSLIPLAEDSTSRLRLARWIPAGPSMSQDDGAVLAEPAARAPY
jgi:4-amino-4-deoxy-L-arabinose transferase-like glycosyltransferase